ncbi:MAG: hypothetical protein JL50_03050 [Peptococcaceae bacterium BICA1-7]|nr:MAG: hypothetical protein JL50_03050 [Peptococcaceae bacterium BICA1-7]HBV97758.1 CMP deaminase [Desulfotomaculum sp.]
MSSSSRPSFESIRMQWVDVLAQRSTCLRQHVACVIEKDGYVISAGYNGLPSGDRNCCDTGVCLKTVAGDEDFKPCLHAEQNALMYAARSPISVVGGTIFINAEPCVTCAKLIVVSKIKKVILRSAPGSKGNEIGVNYLFGHGVEVVYMNQDGEIYKGSVEPR